MANIPVEDVQLKTKLQFSEFVSDHEENIISSQDFRDGKWSDLCHMEVKFEGVYKRVLPVDFRDYCMLVLTKVSPGTSVPRHTHREGIFRYVIEGSFVMNGVLYRTGDWVTVPEGMPYEIQTDEGYVVIAGYRIECGSDGGGNIVESATES